MESFELKKVEPVSFAKIYAVASAVIGLLMVLMYAPVMLFTVPAMDLTAMSMVAGVIGFLLISLIGVAFYAVFGFVTGFFGAFFYNLVAERIGGIELQFEIQPKE